MVELNFNIQFTDLYSVDGLEKIDIKFLDFLKKQDYELLHELLLNRQIHKFSSELIIKISPYLENFIIKLFKLKYSTNYTYLYNKKVSSLFKCRKKFIQRQVRESDYNETKVEYAKLQLKKSGVNLNDEISIATNILKWLKNKDDNLLNHAKVFIAWILYSREGRQKWKNSILFNLPRKLDFERLIKYSQNIHNLKYFVNDKLKNNQFVDDKLKNNQFFYNHQAIVDTSYCLHCHNNKKDSCSKGLIEKSSGRTVDNTLGIKLNGCPLKQKISEMNFLKKEGVVIGAFATAIIDNPMLAATGDRICNECMRSCIYQKQKPVNVPLIESQIFNDILKLDYGFEIYSLLTKWNPLKPQDYLPKDINDHKILIVGMGPAGFTLAHYLTNEGFTVVGIEGLKVEPLNSNLSGILEDGSKTKFQPIKRFTDIQENINTRKAYGFGGVAEYGITSSRWNKNYLTILRIILERRKNFRLYGSVRFGSTITYNSARKLGFEHVALSVGSGKPNIIDITNIMCKGVRLSSDFLMCLQTLCPTRKDSLVNLQIRLPIIIIGGGLTSIDIATESSKYYFKMLKKFLTQYKMLGESFLGTLNEEDRQIAIEFINHANQFDDDNKPCVELLKKWGGIKIIYRNKLEDCPAYKLNYEELQKAFEEGIEFIDKTIPIKVAIDRFNHCEALICNNKTIKAKTIIIATGTHPNTTLSKEYPEYFKKKNGYLHGLNNKLEENFFIHIDDHFSFSVLGDSHPQYSGSVVKAIASAKDSYKIISSKILYNKDNYLLKSEKFFDKLNIGLISKVIKVNRLTKSIIEAEIKSPVAVSEFRPGQFFRLQNFEANARYNIKGYKRIIEPLALTGSILNYKKGTMSLMIFETGGSSNFCQYLKAGETISLMGPTGSGTFIPKKENVILIGSGVRNAGLFSIGKALIANKCYVLYFAGYKKREAIFKNEEIDKSANEIVWCYEESISTCPIKNNLLYHDNIIQALKKYDIHFSKNFKLKNFHRIIVIGSDSMMKAVSYLLQNDSKKLFNNKIKGYASINSPMQCMMKEICGQCLQRHIDHKTKKSKFVYSCFSQDQCLMNVDFQFLSYRLQQNSLLEKLTSYFI